MTTSEKVWRYLRAHSPSTKRQIMAGMKLPHNTVWRALRFLQDRGDVEYRGVNSHRGAWHAVTVEWVDKLGQHPNSLANLKYNNGEWRKFLRMAQMVRGATEETATPVYAPKVVDPWAAAIFGG